MPQTYYAGAIFLARLVLEEECVDMLDIATHLSDEQFIRMRRTMQAAHYARRIPAGHDVFLERARQHGDFDMSKAINIDDEKLQYIWNRFRERAANLARILASRPNGLLIADQLVEGFKTQECRTLLKQFRDQYDRRRNGSDREAANLRTAILASLANQVRPPLAVKELQELLGS